jgi:NAD(P) transhydrogenase
MRNFDVVVVGCGPAGQKAAIKCAKLGKKVALIDRREVVGGRCLHIGTIPSKTMRHAIIYLSGYFERRIYGSDYRVKQDITVEDLLLRCNAIIRRELEVIQGQLVRNGIEVFFGEGSFIDAHTLTVSSLEGTEQLHTQYVIICTGATSHICVDLPFDMRYVLNTDEILSLSFLPQRMAVLGGGVIGLEYASMFSLLGIEVSVITPYPSLLPFVDQQLMEALMKHMQRHGTSFLLEEELLSATIVAPRQVHCELKRHGALEVEMLFYAAPRWGNTQTLNLGAAGLAASDRGYIEVNANYQTVAPHIYAAGDVIGWPSLASTSIDQGRKAANHLLHVKDIPYEPLFPFGIYTFPDISMVGDSEEALKRAGRRYETGIGYYQDSARGQILGDIDGLIKLLFDPDSRELLGVHIIGSEATELIHIGQAVMVHKGKIDYFLDTVFNYPTLAEVYKLAALNGFNKTPAARPTDHL